MLIFIRVLITKTLLQLVGIFFPQIIVKDGYTRLRVLWIGIKSLVVWVILNLWILFISDFKWEYLMLNVIPIFWFPWLSGAFCITAALGFKVDGMRFSDGVLVPDHQVTTTKSNAGV